jgi:GntR family transcriptional regulator
MRPERAVRGSAESVAAVRHLRDLLRSEILEGAYATGMLPGETELMVAYGASRATVRGAFALLREEGIIDRLQGVGTFVVSHPTQARLVGTNFRTISAPGKLGERETEVHPRIIEQGVVPIPRPIANRLGVPPSTPCLRLEFVSLHSDEPHAVITNYTLFPEADRLIGTTYRSDWHIYLAEADVAVGDSEYLIGSVGADSGVAILLQIRAGAPVTFVQQLTFDPDGRPFNFAIMYFRCDRVMFSYRASADQSVMQATTSPTMPDLFDRRPNAVASDEESNG